MADKLALYKQALFHLGAATIGSLTDDVASRYSLDVAWPGAVEEAFNEGDWNFAKASTQLSQSYTVPLAVGWAYVFDYPTDYLRTVDVSPQPRFCGFRDFHDENGGLHARTTTIYLQYISKAKMADNKVNTWPTMFWRYVALKLAYDSCDRITSGSTKTEELRRRLEKALRQAKSVDARQERVKQVGPGSWLRARGGYGGHSNPITTLGGDIQLEEGDV